MSQLSHRPSFLCSTALPYILSILSSPSTTLHTAARRSHFLTALLGPDDVIHCLPDDPLLLQQLEHRANLLLFQIELRLRPSPPTEIQFFLSLLSTLASKYPPLLDEMHRADAVTLVLDTLSRFSDIPHLVSRALAVLRAFTVTDPMRKAVMFHGGIRLTLELMCRHRVHCRVQDRGTAVVANVAFGCTHRKRSIARQGAVRCILEGMAAFPEDEQMQMRGALTIRNLAYGAQVNQYIAGKEGAVERMGALLLRFRGVRGGDVKRQCVLALESLCRDEERNRQRIVDMEVGAKMEAEQKQEMRGAQEEVLNEDGDVLVEEEVLCDLDTSLKRGWAFCPEERSVDLSLGPGSRDEKRSLYSERDKRKYACQEQQMWPENKIKENVSILRSIIHVLRRNPDDANFLESGVSLLTALALRRPEIQLRIGELGGVHLAVAAMKRHEDTVAVVVKACSLIRCLCSQHPNRSLVTSGLQVLITAARKHERNANAVSEVAAAISIALFEHEKNRAWLVRQGGIPALVRPISDKRLMSECGGSDVRMLEACMCALRNCIDSSSSGAITAVDEGAIHVTVNALDSTKDVSNSREQSVQEHAVMFLVEVAALAPQAAERMASIGAVDWIENALARMPRDAYPELHNAGDLLVSVLLSRNTIGHQNTRVDSQMPVQATSPSSSRISKKQVRWGLFEGIHLPRWMTSKGAETNQKAGQKQIMTNPMEPKRRADVCVDVQ